MATMTDLQGSVATMSSSLSALKSRLARGGAAEGDITAIPNNYVTLTEDQTIGGTKTFSEVVIGVTPPSGDDSNKLATTEWVQNYIETL